MFERGRQSREDSFNLGVNAVDNLYFVAILLRRTEIVLAVVDGQTLAKSSIGFIFTPTRASDGST